MAERSQLPGRLGLCFLLFGLVVSAAYGIRGLVNTATEQKRKQLGEAEQKTDPEFLKLLKYTNWANLAHQVWFNVVGAAVGWGAAYCFWIRTGGLRYNYVSGFDLGW